MSWAELRTWVEHLVALDLWSLAEIILTKLQTSHPNEAVRNLFEWLSDQAEKRFAESLVESEGFLLASIHLAFGQYLLSTRSVTDGRRQIGGRLSGICLPLISPRACLPVKACHLSTPSIPKPVRPEFEM